MKSSFLAFLVLLLAFPSPAQQYQPALPGYHYEFPRDHFNHPDYQTEWWYYTGNVKAADGHRFGFELTFFRQAVDHDAGGSPWSMRDIYMAHLALSDISGHRFYHQERINRAGPGLAGVDALTRTIWNGNWQVELGEDRQTLRGIGEQFGFDLHLVPAKRPVIHGREGVSQKAAGIGHASHYISFTRLLTSGSIQLNGQTYQVQGTSWMDHEFFSESMDSTESGWDWLSLQLNDNTELMLYRLRHKDGSVDPYSSGSYIDAQGKCVYLSSKEFAMTPGDASHAEDTQVERTHPGKIWSSPQTHATYPIQWIVSIPTLGLQVEVSTPLPSQEMTATVGPSYWEGAIDVRGTRGGAPLRGVGYLEMTGYAESQAGTKP
jgi:predicted secreted hydrolase